MPGFSVVIILGFEASFSILVFFCVGEITILKVLMHSLNLGEEFKIFKEKIPAIYAVSLLTSFLDKL